MNQHGQRYDQAQQEIVRASVDLEVVRMLDLGVGTGETTRRCLEAHPAARAVCLDQSQDKLDAAANVLGARAELRLGRFQDRLPEGPFELIVSAFALHHVDRAVKADLFPRVAERLSEGGRFVLADVVEPHAPVSEPTPLDRLRALSAARMNCWTSSAMLAFSPRFGGQSTTSLSLPRRCSNRRHRPRRPLQKPRVDPLG
jgi:cyclopropane fatty-acyl-phospholipid synthase-like methyltransferase